MILQTPGFGDPAFGDLGGGDAVKVELNDKQSSCHLKLLRGFAMCGKPRTERVRA